MTRLVSALAAVVAAAVLAAGCGSNSSSSTRTSSSTGAGGSGGYGAGSTAAKTQSQTTSGSSSATSTSSTSGSSTTSRTAIAIAAQDQNGLAFSKKALTAKSGKVTLAMANPSGNSLPHAIAIEGNGVDQKGQTVNPGGGASRVSADLKPGTYTFYCPVDGHRAAGMQGTLTVR